MLEEKEITLYLTTWQKRMVKDYVRSLARVVSFSKIKISIIDKKQWVMYRQPMLESAKMGEWNLYLTDEQISQVVEVMGIKTKISALNISEEMLESKAIAFV